MGTTSKPWTIDQRCKRRDTTAFVVAETVDLLAEKFIGIIADRRMVKMHRYLGEHGGEPRLFVGLRVDQRSYSPVTRRAGEWVGVHLARTGHGLEGVSFGVQRDETEEQARERYHHPDKEWLGERRNLILVELDGWPGSPGREDRIRIEYWNEHGVGQETILVFDDLDPIQEIAWDVKGDRERQVHLWDEFCDVHGLHFEHPDHKSYGCRGRRSTRAEDLAVLAHLAGITLEREEP